MSTVLLFAFLFSAQASAAFFDNSKTEACKGATITSGGGGCDSAAGTKINNVLKTIIDIFSAIVGIAAVVMIIVGGVKFITSSGDAAKTAAARNTILYAVIGLIIVALAQIIVRFVLSKTSKVT